MATPLEPQLQHIMSPMTEQERQQRASVVGDLTREILAKVKHGHGALSLSEAEFWCAVTEQQSSAALSEILERLRELERRVGFIMESLQISHTTLTRQEPFRTPQPSID